MLTKRDERRPFIRPTGIRPDRSPLARIRFLDPGPLPRRDDVPRPAADGALFLGVEASPEGVKVRSNRFGQGRAACGCGCWGRCESERGEEVVARFVEVRGARVQRREEFLRARVFSGSQCFSSSSLFVKRKEAGMLTHAGWEIWTRARAPPRMRASIFDFEGGGVGERSLHS